MTLYEDLGVAPDASPAEIAAAYKRAARQHHPDAGGDSNDFHRVQRAALVLRDPVKRERYDRDGTIDDGPDTTEAEAVNWLVTAFTKVLAATPNLARLDVIGGVKADLQGHIEQLKAARSQVDGEKLKLEKALSRLRFRGNGLNAIARQLGSQIDAHVDKLTAIDREESVVLRAIELAGDYDWEVDPQPVQQGFTQFVPFSTTSSTGWM